MYFQILIRRGCDYVVQYTPDLHRELRGMTAHDASLLFIEEACSLGDVPLTFYSMTKVRAQTWSRKQEHIKSNRFLISLKFNSFLL